MEILPFHEDHIPQAAALFIENFKLQRQAVPCLPERMTDQKLVEEMIARRMAACGGIALVEGERLLGYLGWYISGSFRDTGRKGAYVPEWGHAVAPERRASIYRLLYRKAAGLWTEAGCQVHAITLLAADRSAVDTWFWNGFGLTVVDALRSMDPLCAPAPAGLSLVRAVPEDVGRISEIEAEHWRHYSGPPIYMAANHANTEAELQELLQDTRNTLWMALDDERVAAYVRFEPPDSVAVADTEDTIWIKSAYTRPEYRGRGAMPALIDAGLHDYRQRGCTRCGVDFESFNPEAAAFWPRYFEPIALSVVRVPEKIERPV